MAPPSQLAVEDAREIVLAAASVLPAEEAPLGPSLLGRVLARDMVATEPVPAFDSSAMDGYAVRSGDVGGASAEHPVELPVVEESRAGRPASRSLRHREAIAISTGAVVPEGADAVVRVEDTDGGAERVRIARAPTSGQHVRRAGDDVEAGRTVIGAGTTLGPAELGVLASLSSLTVPCAPRPRLAVVSTGDELVEAGEPLRPGAVRDTNSITVAALAIRAGARVVRTDRAGDSIEDTRRAIAAALEAADVLVICGGVSVGRHDHVRPALERFDARERFWGLALRPGHPTWFGTAQDTLVFGLPGNPVSAMVTFTLLVVPALRALTGATQHERSGEAVMDAAYEKPAGRMHAVRVRLRARADGWHAEPMPAQGSHVLTSMLGADALALVAADAERVEVGERVPVVLLPGGLGVGDGC
jgi:molybdopterin molybdotransferase